MTLESTEKRILPDPVVPPLDDNRRLVELIAEVMQQSNEVIGRQLWDEEHDLGRYHREDFARHGLTPHVWDDKLEQYYRELSVWLPSYAVWNRRPAVVTSAVCTALPDCVRWPAAFFGRRWYCRKNCGRNPALTGRRLFRSRCGWADCCCPWDGSGPGRTSRWPSAHEDRSTRVGAKVWSSTPDPSGP